MVNSGWTIGIDKLIPAREFPAVAQGILPGFGLGVTHHDGPRIDQPARDDPRAGQAGGRFLETRPVVGVQFSGIDGDRAQKTLF